MSWVPSGLQDAVLTKRMKDLIHLHLLLLLCLSACPSPRPQERYFNYARPGSDDIAELSAEDIQHLKLNLYRVGDKLALGTVYHVATVAPGGKDAVVMDSLGTMLFDLATFLLPVDTASYHWVVPDLIAADRDRVYAFPRRYHLPTVKLLALSPTSLMRCDEDATYLKDADTVYCIPTDTYLGVPPTRFSTVRREGVTYGYDSIHYYYFDEVESPPGVAPK